MLYMVMRVTGGYTTRYGKPSRSIDRAVRQCDKCDRGSYVIQYPGNAIAYVNTPEFREAMGMVERRVS